jgi:hypothetical protein
MEPMKLSEIRSAIPTTYELMPGAADEIHYDEFKDTRRLYGKKLMRLTPSLARALVGMTVYGLEGQAWMKVRGVATTRNGRAESLSKIQIVGFDDEGDLRYRVGRSLLAAWQQSGAYVTGSGDPLYVFAKKGPVVPKGKSSKNITRKRTTKKSTGKSKGKNTRKKSKGKTTTRRAKKM